MRRLMFAEIAMLALVAAACSSSHPGAGKGAATPRFTPTLEAPPAAIQQLLTRVGELRQLSPPADLQVGLVSRSDVPKLLKSLTSAADAKSMQQTTILYRLLGHLRPDQDYDSVYQGFVAQSLVGLYSPKDKALWVVHPDGEPTDFNNLNSQETQVLVHELVHALQDAHFDLQGMANATAGNLDLSLAATSVIEGDAVSTQRNYSARYTAVPDGSAILFADVSRFADSTPASIQRELLFPYTEGSDWIDAIRAKGGNAAVDALLQHPPTGTVYIFHPGLLNSRWRPKEVQLPDLTAPLGGGWRKDSEGQFGEFELQNYLQLRLPGLQAVQAASGWQGDHYAVYVNGTQSAAVFRVVFSDADEARTFAAAQDDLLKGVGAKASMGGRGQVVKTEASGNTTIRLSPSNATVTFIIASNAKVARTLADALVHG